MRLLIVFVLAAGCGGGARTAPVPTAPGVSGNAEVMRPDAPAQRGTLLRVTLDAQPELRIGEERQLTVHVRITNEGEEAVDADALTARLQVDDLPAIPVDLRGHGWVRLAPGESAEWDERNVRIRLLEPGEHTLRLEVGDAMSPPVRVVVTE